MTVNHKVAFGVGLGFQLSAPWAKLMITADSYTTCARCTNARKRGTIDGQIYALFMLTRRRSLIALAIITGVGACLRFYGLSKGAPYHHFHIDEHFVFAGADLLRQSMSAAAESQKFFMYGPLPMHMVNVVRSVYEWFSGPLTLSAPDRRHDLHAAGPQHLGAARHGDDTGGLFDRTPPRRTGGGTDCGRLARKRRPARPRLAFLYGRRQHGVLLRRHMGGGGGDRRSGQASARSRRGYRVWRSGRMQIQRDLSGAADRRRAPLLAAHPAIDPAIWPMAPLGASRNRSTGHRRRGLSAAGSDGRAVPPEVPRRRRGSDLESPAWRIAPVVECELPRRATAALLVHQSPAVGNRAGIRGLGRRGSIAGW